MLLGTHDHRLLIPHDEEPVHHLLVSETNQVQVLPRLHVLDHLLLSGQVLYQQSELLHVPQRLLLVHLHLREPDHLNLGSVLLSGTFVVKVGLVSKICFSSIELQNK